MKIPFFIWVLGCELLLFSTFDFFHYKGIKIKIGWIDLNSLISFMSVFGIQIFLFTIIIG